MLEKDTSLTEEEKACLLLESMITAETKELVKTAIQGDNGYENGLKTLRQKYGRERTIFREHLQILTKASELRLQSARHDYCYGLHTSRD